ncbi:uncharacterized protein LOC100712513 isoform X2 [Oreochromis niloticus]|uniref:uncharacterized protein LOC100712513 isoform X2 n=1 Tax=Oreochromis niloticus TaxID=8128 RepID=UPI000DF47962|nr:uncharacterized protein LOC100712513 isoform X2 [Oreochromis niloticus]XP_025761103.1 uncharacterized protein LOC100712513 isoform X2 [Oreochromis niloticus]CAI5660130.1 unnamed protein product [Mustela putorius furo]
MYKRQQKCSRMLGAVLSFCYLAATQASKYQRPVCCSKRKDVHIADLYVVATWKDPQVNLLRCLPDNFRSKDILLFPAWSRQAGEADHHLLCAILVAERQILFLDSLHPDGFGDDLYRAIFRRVAAIIDSGSWMEKTVLEFFPQQLNGNCRGIFMLMYALCISTSCPLSFTEEDMPAIRLWWCIQLMERFCIDGLGQRFAYTKDLYFTVTSMCPHRHIGRGCSKRRGYSHLQTGSGVLHVQRPCVY